jgi:DNA mismatch endonuclease (patch repair protein)
MPERLTQAERSRLMAAVKSRDTTPEMVVRRLVHRLGYRFRLHRRDLPGTPDLVLPRLRKVINVHGCFWHMHACQRRRRDPVNNADYWRRKREGNVARDARNVKKLSRRGWKILVVWECQTRDILKLTARIATFLKR